ncbi:hypothetical protein CPB85DRAFT_1216507 [Mucidula mucida]|nr:hypothetical protein CPB85DRAFT_1216507 [Mucidula mucida]
MAIEYNITRPIPIRWFAPVVYFFGLIVVGLLTVLNVALVGYETITIFNPNPNYTQSEWYDVLPMRAPTPGSACAPTVFNVGDSFTTNYSMFQWTIESIPQSNTGTGVLYKGTPLDHCDLTSLYIHGDSRSYAIDYTGVVTCKAAEGYKLRAKTAFTLSNLPGKYSPFTEASGQPIFEYLGLLILEQMTPGGLPSVLSMIASGDIGLRMLEDMFFRNNGTTPIITSVQIDFPPCPASLGTSAECATSVPTYNVSAVALGYADLQLALYSASLPISDTNKPLLTDDYNAPLSNIVQVIAAGIRLDLGNPSPNNLFLNDAVVDDTLYATFPATNLTSAAFSSLYMVRKSPALAVPGSKLETILPLNVSGPAVARVAYACRYQRRKAPGSLIVSVLVATLTMSSSIWAVFMLLTTAWVKRRDRQGMWRDFWPCVLLLMTY